MPKDTQEHPVGKQWIAAIEKVKLSVVRIRIDHGSDAEPGLGTGFVVDAARGLIATNYHVIDGAKRATATLSLRKDKKEYPVEGFLAILPGKDLALIRIKPDGEKLQALKLAERLPIQGDPVMAAEAIGGRTPEGTVAVVRSGHEVSDLMAGFAGPDVYTKVLKYDLDVTWIQTTISTSRGNSGDPVVSTNGEVVGVSTFHNPGDDVIFAISATHLKQLMATAGTKVQPLSNLPPPRYRRTSNAKGDP